MSYEILLLRGTTAQNDEAVRSPLTLTVDLETPSLRIHDDHTPGGMLTFKGVFINADKKEKES